MQTTRMVYVLIILCMSGCCTVTQMTLAAQGALDISYSEDEMYPEKGNKSSQFPDSRAFANSFPIQ